MKVCLEEHKVVQGGAFLLVGSTKTVFLFH